MHLAQTGCQGLRSKKPQPPLPGAGGRGQRRAKPSGPCRSRTPVPQGSPASPKLTLLGRNLLEQRERSGKGSDPDPPRGLVLQRCPRWGRRGGGGREFQTRDSTAPASFLSPSHILPSLTKVTQKQGGHTAGPFNISPPWLRTPVQGAVGSHEAGNQRPPPPPARLHLRARRLSPERIPQP